MTDMFGLDQFERDRKIEEPVKFNRDTFGLDDEGSKVKAIQSNIELSRDLIPDKESRAVNLSKKLNIPLTLVRGNEDKFEKASNIPDAHKLVSGFMGTANYYKDLDATAVSYDDSEELMNVESVWDRIKRIPSKAGESYDIGSQNVEGMKLYSEKIFDILSGSDSPELAQKIAEFEAKRLVDTEDINFVETGVTAAAEMVPLIIDVLAAGQTEGLTFATMFGLGAVALGQLGPQALLPEEIITGPAATGIGYAVGIRVGASKRMFQLEGGAALQEMLEVTNENGEKIEPQVAALAAIGVGTLNAALELVGIRSISKLLPGGIGDKLIGGFTREAVKNVIKKESVREALKAVLKRYGKTLITETLTEIGQEVVTILGTEIAKDISDGEFEDIDIFQEALPRLVETAKQAFAAIATLALPIASVRAGYDVQKVKEQQKFSEDFDQIKEAVEATKTKERSPAMTEKHLENLELGDAYISAEGIIGLFQESPEIAPDILQRAGINPTKARQDAASGNDTRVSLSRIHAHLDVEEQGQLKPNLKLAPSAMTENEVAAIDIQQEIQRTEEQVKDYTARQKSLQQTKSSLKKQIVDTGLSKQYADDVITLAESFADKMGVESTYKEDLMKKIAVQASAVDAEGIQFDQGIDDLDLDFAITHLSPEKEINEIKKGGGGNIFDGIFGSRGEESLYTVGKFEHTYYPRKGKVAGSGDWAFNYDKTVETLKKEYPDMSDEDFSLLYEMAAEDKTIEQVGGNPLAGYGFGDYAEAEWEAQRLRGRIAVDQDFDAVAVSDEFGTSYLIPAGSKAKRKSDIPQDPNILFQTAKKIKKYFQDKLGFYSSVSKAVDEIDFKKMPGKDLLKRLNKTAGVKKELEWMGLPEFLELKGKVSKEEVQAFIKSGGVRLEEVVKGGLGVEGRSARMEILIDRENAGTITTEEKEELDTIEQQVSTGEETVDDTKYSDRTLPGGENYREVLLTLPTTTAKEDFESWVSGEYGIKYSKMNDMQKLNARSAYEQIKEGSRKPEYKSTHYDEPNILAHFRLNDRTDSEGKKTLFIEEIQSDWHQEARKIRSKEVKRVMDSEGINKKEANKIVPVDFGYIGGKEPTITQHGISIGGVEPNIFFDTKEEAQERIDRISKNFEGETLEIVEVERVATTGIKLDAVPNAPFKSTKAWSLLAFKRVLRMAAERGYDSVAWTPGDIQVDRYDLSKQVDGVTISKNSNGTYDIDIEKDGAIIGDIQPRGISIEQVESTVGKDLAKKAQNQTEETVEYSGLDLKVGGEGMKKFYDEMLPSIVQKYVKKKLDKSVKVGTSEIEGDLFVNDNAPPVDVWNVPITDKMKAKILEGQALFQESKRGSVNITDDKYIISLFENKNYSTLVHELGHVFLNEYSILAEQSENIKENFENLTGWLNNDQAWLKDRAIKEAKSRKDVSAVESLISGVDDELSQKYYDIARAERFATAFETYLAEGKAPTRELKTVFRRFKNWLLSVYQKAVNTGVALDPEIRGIFDRMFTTRLDAVNSAQENNMEMWTKEEMDALAVLPDDRKYMQDLYKASIETAAEEVTWRQNKARAENNKRWKAQTKLEVDSMPVYVAESSVKKGGGLNEFAVNDLVGAKSIEHLRKRYGNDFVKEDGGLDPVEVAALSGFVRSYDMIHELIIAESRDSVYQAELLKKQAASDANYQVEDYLTDSKEWEEFLRLKSSYLMRADGLPSNAAPTKAFRQFAKEQLDAEEVRDAIANKRYLSNAAKYSGIERNKMRLKKYGEASRASQIARLNFVKANLAINNREFYTKTLRGVKTLLKSKSITTDTQYQITDLAARFGIVPRRPGESINDATARVRIGVPVEDKVPIYDWVQEKLDAGYEIQLPAFVLDGTTKEFRELTWEQFEELKESFDQIKTVDRQERYYTAFEKAQTMEEVKLKLFDELYKNYDEKSTTAREEFKAESFVKEFDAWSTKIEILLRQMDGGKVNGVWWTYFFKPLEDAWANEADRHRVIRKELVDLFKLTNIKSSLLSTTFTEGMPRPLKHSQMLAVGLNWGTQDNRNKLMDGWGWSESQVASILDNLTESDWKFITETWKYIDSFRPESFDLAKEMTGKRPPKVEGIDVVTKYGTFKGSYYTLAYDPSKSLRTSQNRKKDKSKEMFQKSHGVPNTKPTSHIERKASAGGQKVILDLGVIPEHIFDVVHDITHRKAVVNIAKLARDKDILKAWEGTIGVHLGGQFNDWLVDVSNEQERPTSPIHRMAAFARKGVTVVSLGLKVTTMVQQPLGALSIIDEIGPEYWTKGVNMLYGTGGAAPLGERIEFIKKNSGMMRNRLLSFDRDIRDSTKAITPVKKARADIIKFSFIGIGLTQFYGVDAPGWLGSYQKYLDEYKGSNLNEANAKAKEYANSIVRQTQGGGATKDLSKIQRGDELMRLLTMFYSYFNTQYGLAKLRISQTAKGQRPPAYLVASAVLLWFLPSIMSELVSARGPADDEDFKDWALPIVSMYPFQTMVGVRDVASAIGTPFGYKLTPAETAPEKLVWLSKDIYDAITDEDSDNARLAEKALEASGYLAHIPSKQMQIILFNMLDLMTGEDDELNYSDLLRRNRK